MGQEPEASALRRWQPSPRQSPEWAQGLAELSKSLGSQRSYLNPRDGHAREFHYDGIAWSAAPGALFKALSRLARETHERSRPELPMRLIYSWVDLRPDGKLRCVFSNQEYEPTELMRRDHEVCLKRVRDIKRAAELPLSGESLMRELARIEARRALNCVEVIPLAWHRGPGHVERRVDLHHRFACGTDAQRFRGDRSYGECRTAPEASLTAAGAASEDWFEPTAGKGAIARAALYFLLRYPGVLEAARFGPEAEGLKTLLGWHLGNPVSDHERHRNQTIFGLQGNRNPLIDYPDQAARIDFRLALR